MPVTITTQRRTHIRRSMAHACAAALIGSLLMAGAGPAGAADDDDDTLDTKFMKNILTNLGLKLDSDPGIDYHERSPLVVPPTRELPPPDTGVIATRDPSWPKDPDVRRRSKEVKRATQRLSSSPELDASRQLRPDELRNRRPDGSVVTGSTPRPPSEGNEQMSPSQLGFKGFSLTTMFSREGKAVPFVQEPPRTQLTDPPPGLRTPSPRYEYGNKNKLEPTRSVVDAPVGVQ